MTVAVRREPEIPRIRIVRDPTDRKRPSPRHSSELRPPGIERSKRWASPASRRPRGPRSTIFVVQRVSQPTQVHQIVEVVSELSCHERGRRRYVCSKGTFFSNGPPPYLIRRTLPRLITSQSTSIGRTSAVQLPRHPETPCGAMPCGDTDRPSASTSGSGLRGAGSPSTDPSNSISSDNTVNELQVRGTGCGGFPAFCCAPPCRIPLRPLPSDPRLAHLHAAERRPRPRNSPATARRAPEGRSASRRRAGGGRGAIIAAAPREGRPGRRPRPAPRGPRRGNAPPSGARRGPGRGLRAFAGDGAGPRGR